MGCGIAMSGTRSRCWKASAGTRSTNLWHKPNAMPGYWPTRLRDAWEYCFHLSRSKRPYVDFDAVKRPIGDWAGSRLARLGRNDTTRQNSSNASGFGRNISRWADRKTVLPDNVLSLPLVGKNKGHPAVFPVELPTFFIRLLSPAAGLVIDPFAGSGTRAVAAFREGRSCVLIDNNKRYCRQAEERLRSECDLIIPVATRAASKRGRTGQIKTSRVLAAPKCVSSRPSGCQSSMEVILSGETESGILSGAE